MNREEKIMRIQADKLCVYLGYEAGTKIPEYMIKIIAGPSEFVIVDGKEVKITPQMRALAGILLEKI